MYLPFATSICKGAGQTERAFAAALDAAGEVAVYAKLPRGFQIPTPVGGYAPDWAIAFKEGAVRHLFFVAETKGTLDTMELRGVEECKINCAKTLFAQMGGRGVRYHHVATCDDLLTAIGQEGWGRILGASAIPAKKETPMQVKNLETEKRRITASLGAFSVLEYVHDASVSPADAATEYFMSRMNVRRRQLVASLGGGNSVVVQAGSMQWAAGSVRATSGIKGAGDLLGKVVRGSVTKESAVKPEYAGEGLLVLEPTYKYLLLIDLAGWGKAGMTVEDGMFLACEGSVRQEVTARKSVSSAVLGGEGLFSLNLAGTGVVALECTVPEDELIEVQLQNDELRIDGNLAVCWSKGLSFTVERATRSLAGSAVSGEGLVNVYRGTGKVLLCPVAPTSSLAASTTSHGAKTAAKNSNTLGN